MELVQSDGYQKEVPLKQEKADWTGDNANVEIGKKKMSDITGVGKGVTLIVKVTTTGTTEITKK